MATTDLIPFTLSATTLIWDQPTRHGIAKRGPEGTMAFVQLANGSETNVWSGEKLDVAIVGGITCNGTFASPAANSSAGWQMGNLPAKYSYVGAGPIAVNPLDESWLMASHAEQWAGSGARPADYWSYSVLSRSTDQGASWTYIGDMVGPQFQFDNTQNLGHGYDIGNGMLLPVGLYVYQWYREIPTATPTTNNPICVARCLASDLFSSSIAGTPSVGTWKKWGGSSWNQDPMTGLGAAVIPYDASFVPFWPSASLDAQTGTIFLVIETNALTNNIQMYMYQSSDVLHYTPKSLIDTTTATNSIYPGPRSSGYVSEYSGTGPLYVYSPEVSTYWTAAIVNRRTLTLNNGCPRTNRNRTRGGPALGAAR